MTLYRTPTAMVAFRPSNSINTSTVIFFYLAQEAGNLAITSSRERTLTAGESSKTCCTLVEFQCLLKWFYWKRQSFPSLIVFFDNLRGKFRLIIFVNRKFLYGAVLVKLDYFVLQDDYPLISFQLVNVILHYKVLPLQGSSWCYAMHGLIKTYPMNIIRHPISLF